MVRNELRLVYRITGVIILLYVYIISLFGYILTTDNVNITDMMYILGFCASFVYTHVFVPYVTYLNREELRTILQRIDNEFDFSRMMSNRCTTNIRQKYNTIAEGTKLLLYSVILSAVILFVGLVYAILFCDQNSLDSPDLFLLYMPFANQIHSYTVFVLVYCSTTALSIPGFVLNASVVLFNIMVGQEFYNAYLNLSALFHDLISDTIFNLRICCANKNDSQVFESNVFHTFKEELGLIARQHQYLKK